MGGVNNPIGGSKKSHQLALQFVDRLTQGFDPSDSRLLVPSSDGRLLVPHDPQRQFAWSVTDFDVPFAHVLQSSNAMHLTAEELVFWQNNRTFSHLTSRVGCLIQYGSNLPMDTRQIHSILLLMGESHGIVSAFGNADF